MLNIIATFIIIFFPSRYFIDSNHHIHLTVRYMKVLIYLKLINPQLTYRPFRHLTISTLFIILTIQYYYYYLIDYEYFFFLFFSFIFYFFLANNNCSKNMRRIIGQTLISGSTLSLLEFHYTKKIHEFIHTYIHTYTEYCIRVLVNKHI